MGRLKEIAEFVKAVTRPFCLVVLVVIVALMVYQGREVPTWAWGTFIPMFFWWSVDRSLTHRSERRGTNLS